MSLSIPPELKVLTAFIRRGEELEKDQMNPDSRTVAYYCKTFAMEKGIKMRLNSPEVNTFLMALMDSLESSKKSLLISPESGAATCENYALSVFDKADDEDRAGEATKGTAKIFYTASTFFDILEQFGELDAELVEKRKYSKWKAADILSAIKQGIQPTIGAPGEVLQSESPSSGQMPAMLPDSDLSSVIPAAPTSAPIAPVYIPEAPFTVAPPPSQQYNAAPPQQRYQPPPQQYQPPPQQSQHNTPFPASYSQPSHAPSNYTNNVGSRPVASNADSKVKDAIEYASFAITALKHNNIALAKERLMEALRQIE